jgi:hypothetical protein
MTYAQLLDYLCTLSDSDLQKPVRFSSPIRHYPSAASTNATTITRRCLIRGVGPQRGARRSR